MAAAKDWGKSAGASCITANYAAHPFVRKTTVKLPELGGHASIFLINASAAAHQFISQCMAAAKDWGKSAS